VTTLETRPKGRTMETQEWDCVQSWASKCIVYVRVKCLCKRGEVDPKSAPVFANHHFDSSQTSTSGRKMLFELDVVVFFHDALYRRVEYPNVDLQNLSFKVTLKKSMWPIPVLDMNFTTLNISNLKFVCMFL
jgi:hypothetical protein